MKKGEDRLAEFPFSFSAFAEVVLHQRPSPGSGHPPNRRRDLVPHKDVLFPPAT
ncbi:MAG: hypothetical protein M0C28_07065 [Candidatus Moduliflexus flocculans]|nr:hypothetical protein [Candidatus Moduliflexus flocculans]